METGLFNREWSVVEQRRQELLAEAATIWLIRNAHADDPMPARESSRSRLGTVIDNIVREVPRPSIRLLRPGLRSLRDELS
jgi:hypothetical protein